MGIRAFGAMLLLAAVAVVGAPTPALASCAFPARTSANAFAGTVTATSNGARVATVRTDGGVVVTVVGTPDQSAAATSVDRQYVVGTRYEFHPINNESPYQDNACTATHEIAGGSVPGGPGPGGSRAGGWRWLAVVGVVAGGLAVAVVAVGMRRRAARRPSNSS